jgi:hypothetical protein
MDFKKKSHLHFINFINGRFEVTKRAVGEVKIWDRDRKLYMAPTLNIDTNLLNIDIWVWV